MATSSRHTGVYIQTARSSLQLKVLTGSGAGTLSYTVLLKDWDRSEIMLATRTLLSKQTLAVLSRQPACFVHHGDYGNWGNTNIAVVSVYQNQHGTRWNDWQVTSVCTIVICGCVPGFLRMWMVGWDWCPRGSIVSITPCWAQHRYFSLPCRDSNWHLCPQHHVPPEPQRCSLPDVRSKSAANACDGPHEKAAGHRGEPVGLPANTDALSDASQTGPVTYLTISLLHSRLD